MSIIGLADASNILLPLTQLSALLIAGLGAGVMFFERFTDVSRRYFVVMVILAAWIAPLGFAHVAPTPAIEDLWLRVAYVAAPFTIPGLYWLARATLLKGMEGALRVTMVIAAVFSAVNVAGPWLVDGLRALFVDHTLAGTGWLGLAYAIFELVGVVPALALSVVNRRNALSGAGRKEALALGVAAVLAYAGYLDYFLARDPFRAGILTPLAILAAAMVVTWTAVRFRTFADGRSFATEEVLQTMADAVLACDALGRIRGANLAATELLQRSEHQLQGEDIGTVVGWSGEKWKPWRPREDSAVDQLDLRAADGSTIRVSASAEQIHFGPRHVGTVIVARDIRSKLESARALEAAELRYRALFAHNPGLTYEVDTEGRFVTLNDRAAQTLGVPREEAVGASFGELLHPADREEAGRIFERASRGEPTEYEITLNSATDEPVRVKGVSIPILEDGQLVGVAGVGFDVTGERRARRELEVQRRYFEALFENIPEAIVLVDENDRVREVNRGFTELFGYTEDEAVGRDIDELIVPEHLWDRGRALAREAAAGDSVRTETVRRRKDGSTVEVSVLAHELMVSGAGRQIYGVYRDITERKAAERRLKQQEEELRHAQRVEAIGKLAGGVAHDFNNLLTVINGHVQMALEQAGPECSLREELDEIGRAGERAAQLTHQLLAFSRRQMLQPRVMDANAVVREILTMLRRLIGEHIRIETRLDAEPLHVRADRGQVEQVITNMALNARDAMPDGGTFTIETDVVTLEPGDERAAAWELEPGSYICIRLTDNGTGMDEDTQTHVFEPFFTTKPKGRGTGLGLATAFGIVKQSGGHITVRSAPGDGSEFLVLLPRVPAPSEAGEESEPEPSGTLAGTVLVVEDEAPVRGLAVRILEKEGCTVLAAENGVRALELLEREEQAVDLVVTDIIMPEMGGHELADRLHRDRPDLPVLFMSGYDDELAAGDGDAPDFLPKPFTPRAFARWVARGLQHG